MAMRVRIKCPTMALKKSGRRGTNSRELLGDILFESDGPRIGGIVSSMPTIAVSLFAVSYAG